MALAERFNSLQLQPVVVAYFSQKPLFHSSAPSVIFENLYLTRYFPLPICLFSFVFIFLKNRNKTFRKKIWHPVRRLKNKMVLNKMALGPDSIKKSSQQSTSATFHLTNQISSTSHVTFLNLADWSNSALLGYSTLNFFDRIGS